MKTLINSFCVSIFSSVLMSLFIGICPSSAAETSLVLPDPDTMVFEPLSFHTREPEIEMMKTGLEFWFIPDRTVPLVTLVVDLNAGGFVDPDGKVGVAEMTAETLIRGGTETMTAGEFTDKAALMGFDFSVRPDAEFTQISVTCLSTDMKEAAGMLMDAIEKPGFDKDQMELVRAEQMEQIQRMEQEPFFLAFNTLEKRIYGTNHPKARIATADSLNAIDRGDLVAFHRDFYTPDISRFAVIGAASSDDLKQLKKRLVKWRGKAAGKTGWPAPEPVSETAAVILVDRPGTQAVIAMGHLGVEPRHPYRYDLDIFNEIYGSGGMSSRLMNQVRTQKGLAYVVFGSQLPALPTGMFMAGCMTRNESVVDAIQTIQAVTKDMQMQNVPDKELQQTMESLENSFVFKFERPRQVLQRMLINRRMGLPDDYLQTYLENIRKVTPDSIRTAVAETIFPDKIQIVVAGPADFLKPELEKLGLPVEVIARHE